MAGKKQTAPTAAHLMDRIVRRALYYSTQMIHLANNRDDVQKGDPKVGGHPAACASSTHILGAIHLSAREPQDFIAVKPHASPMDHSYSYLLSLFYHNRDHAKAEQRFSDDEARAVMRNLRKFMNPADPNHEPAFQSYHAVWDADSFHYFPSGSVGIPPVTAAYTSLAYRFAERHGFDVPKNSHFWSIIGDSEFREGSLAECMPDVAERELNNVTWIVDYNRQNLDGTRIFNEAGFAGTDADRIERMAAANGWRVVQARHGKKRLEFFKKYGDEVKKALEGLTDFELQALLIKKDGKAFGKRLGELVPKAKSKLQGASSAELLEVLEDLGGHDFALLSEIFAECRRSKKPTLVVAHTIKGWGLRCQAATGNHSMLPDDDEVVELAQKQGINPEKGDDLFMRFPNNSDESKFLDERGRYLRSGIEAQRALRDQNAEKIKIEIEKEGGFPTSFGINLKLAPWANTQWMWGQLAAKLIRIANLGKAGELSADEKPWNLAGRYLVTLAPDVGTSTNLNPSMDGKVFGPDVVDFEALYDVKDKRRPNLVPLEKEANRHLRFEIEEGNAMTCAGAFGKMTDHVGLPILPMMTIYDFFIKRALDQYFYNLYWRSGFILVGTPSGVTLSPEGAQHSWKSDIQIPNGVTWEPAFAIEMDWILADAVRRHFTHDNVDREGVLIRAVTRSIEQKVFIESLREQVRFTGMDDAAILEATRLDVLAGGYWLSHFEGFDGYAPGDNVVHIAVMGALVPEAVAASKALREQGYFANILVVTSPDLLAGNLAQQNGYD
ncbi:MAG TPA: pyruvate dehydrogenase, partial [Oligoflexia bacterium]|nr:pyruvate dehydrogenase [Oligoflexia bacterium]